MNRKLKKLITTVLTMVVCLSFFAKANAQSAVFGDAGWDSMKFHNAVAMLIAETAYGYETDEMSGSTAITYNALKRGDIDIYMETWTDSIEPYQRDVEKGKIIELGINYDDNKQGLYVPRYVIEGDAARGIPAMAPNLKTVEDLKGYASLFADPEDKNKGRIFGAISGWAIDEVMRKKIEFYGLDSMYNYIDPGSDAALAAAIVGAYEKGEPIVAYYWEPAWITGKYDLVLLEDAPYEQEKYLEGECACPSIRLTVSVNPDFHRDNPELCAFLSKYKTSSAWTAEALSYINEHDASYRDAARWFIGEHPELLKEWLPENKVQAVLDAVR